ncbi:MAG: hypothetical protein KY476_16100 [Planctomycetes bacterium]|nr:hypothetical protein [Planctomycetota bacterium]
MNSVFVLQHVHSRPDGDEDVKLVGVYSSRQKADAAVARLSRMPGFADAPDGFHIDEYRLDRDQWAEGYVAVAGA